MTDVKLFQYAVVWCPTDEMESELGSKPKLVVPINSILAKDEKSVMMQASREIPIEYSEDLDRIKIFVRLF